MLTLIAAALITQKMPDTALRLKVGDAWTAQYTYHYTGDDVDLANVETIKFAVVREGKWRDDPRVGNRPGLRGRKLGVMGLGAIGEAVAVRAAAIRCRRISSV